jgi:NAD(P)H-hydrate epimerase
VLLLTEADALSVYAAEQLRRLGGPAATRPWSSQSLAGAGGAIDAILGTGFQGRPRGAAAEAIQALSALDGPVVAADVPSGVDASTGEVSGAAVRATVTVAFHAAKLGHWVHPGKALAGEVRVVDIGIPPQAPQPVDAGLIGDGVLAALPARTAASTKFTSGNVVVVGGSIGLTGAPTMAALAAQRAGAGYVTVAGPASLELAFATRLLEAMFAGLPEADGHLASAALDGVLARCERASAVVVGPGIGRVPDSQALVRSLVERVEVPLVLDADGLNALGTDFARPLQARRAATVLTPHAGELGRLLGVASGDVDSARVGHVRRAASEAGAIVVLKGDDTLVAMPDARVAVSAGGAPGLATAGTGDVLAGVVGALLARGVDAEHAVCAAVHAHLRAGRLAGIEHGNEHVIASDVIAALSRALRP